MRTIISGRIAAIAIAVVGLASTSARADVLRWVCPGPGRTHYAVLVDDAKLDHVTVEEFHAGSTAPVRRFELSGGVGAHAAVYEDEHLSFSHDRRKARLSVRPKGKPRNCGKPHEID
ncbi:MAG: hypothetical protein GX458_14840 [Phyllobacteriaceae bacterium]|nr:hypothetical protein [Phyllobacteriaceae bacterium]